ncbi:class I SAM-dependent methyltransferase [Pseudomonas sp. RIT-PI-AD]|uniref:class I SAM-dependent methyltransferase n=1 Tax=Pseudomonas sp. RIT-PI-AD TaxID=3035294 RepID=UPI0021DB3779|nr:class I SAM-dependent methyltransferase [Pseudomonas sp. RIT-PI-AD]
MDPRSEVLLRQAQRFRGPVLLAGLPADDLLGHLPDALGWSWQAGDQASLEQRFPERCHFGIRAPALECRVAVLFLPKSRELTDYLLTALAARVGPAGEVFLVGEKRAGIERAGKQLAAFGAPRKLDSARHCQLWEAQVERAPKTPDPQAWAERFSLDLVDGALQVVSLPGVFSHGRLDKGSALLLQHLDGLPRGPLLDFGCGAGVLGAWLKRHYPDSPVHLLDVDAFAVESSRLTLAANGLDAEVIAADSLQAVPGELAAIVSNPPFHQGVHTDYQATEAMLRDARRHLLAKGELRMVANAFLKYPPLIEEHLGACRTLAATDGFRVYRASRR